MSRTTYPHHWSPIQRAAWATVHEYRGDAEDDGHKGAMALAPLEESAVTDEKRRVAMLLRMEPKLRQQIERMANEHRRSVTMQVLWLIERGIEAINQRAA